MSYMPASLLFAQNYQGGYGGGMSQGLQGYGGTTDPYAHAFAMDPYMGGMGMPNDAYMGGMGMPNMGGAMVGSAAPQMYQASTGMPGSAGPMYAPAMPHKGSMGPMSAMGGYGAGGYGEYDQRAL